MTTILNRIRSSSLIPSFKNRINLLSVAEASAVAVAKRTTETNPTNHTTDFVGLFYTIPEEDNKIFSFGGFPRSFQNNLKTFNETCLMVRKPALEIINYLKETDFKRPAVRYVIYGKPGCGKSVTLAHILHYAHRNQFYILHVPWVWNWFRNNRTEVVSSTSKPGQVDLPLLSAQWLKHFQSQNSLLLDQNDITISKDYVWNQRETTPAGSQLSGLVLHGINRVKYAGECIDATIAELKLAAAHDKCKVVVAVDGFNGLLDKESNYKTDDRSIVTTNMVTLTHSFLDATKQDWVNAAIIVTVDQMAGRHGTQHSHLPLYLLGKKGFEHLDPFIPVSVTELTEVELNSMLDYYEDRRWIHGGGARQELAFLSNNNPYQLMNLVAGL